MSSRGYEDYTGVKKAETNLYKVQKQAKLALVIASGKEQLIGKGHQVILWGNGIVLYLIRVLVMWVYTFFKTHKNIHLGFVYFTMCKLYQYIRGKKSELK